MKLQIELDDKQVLDSLTQVLQVRFNDAVHNVIFSAELKDLAREKMQPLVEAAFAKVQSEFDEAKIMEMVGNHWKRSLGGIAGQMVSGPAKEMMKQIKKTLNEAAKETK